MGFHRLYVRIWLAVLLAVAVLSLLVGWVWRVTSEPPLREVVVRNANGEIIGAGVLRLGRPNQSGGPQGDPPGDPPPPDDHAPGRYGSGPEFIVNMTDGRIIHLHLPRQAEHRAPFGFFSMLGLVAVAVAFALLIICKTLDKFFLNWNR